MHRILVFESSPKTRELLLELLNKHGFIVQFADSAFFEQALSGEYIPDLIICESESPNDIRYGLLQKLRRYFFTARVPIILTSYSYSNIDIQNAALLGADDFIIIPIDLNRFLLSINFQLHKQNVSHDSFAPSTKNISHLLSHELRTPLVAILGFSEILAEKRRTLASYDCLELLERITDAGKKLLRFIEKYSQYLECEAIRKSARSRTRLREARVTSSTAILYETCFTIALEYMRQEHIVFELKEGPAPATEEHLRIILSELAENACKHSPPETPITIKSYTYENSFFVELENHCRTDLELENNTLYSLHIREDMPFSLTWAGIGLSIASTLVNIYNGKLMIRSKPPGRISVTVSLPFSKF